MTIKRKAPAPEQKTAPVRRRAAPAPAKTIRRAAPTPAPTQARRRRIQPMGGHMPFPPEDCRRPDKIIRNDDGGVWIDINICRGYCPKMCEKALKLKKMPNAHLHYHDEVKALNGEL